MTLIPGWRSRIRSTCSGKKRRCTEQCPFHRITFALRSLFGRLPALQLVGVPHHHLVEPNPHVVAGVASQMLVGKKEDLTVACKGPLHGRASVAAGAHCSAALAHKGLDDRRRIHVGQRRDALPVVAGQSQAYKLLPGIFHLRDIGHIGHRAARIQVRQYHLLLGPRQNIGRLGHEVHTAEDNVASPGLRGQLREPPTVTLIVGKLDHFVALIMVPQHDTLLAQNFPGGTNASVHRVIRLDEVIVQGAHSVRNDCCHHCLSAFSLRHHRACENGDVESAILRLQRMHMPLQAPPTGMLKP